MARFFPPLVSSVAVASTNGPGTTVRDTNNQTRTVMEAPSPPRSPRSEPACPGPRSSTALMKLARAAMGQFERSRSFSFRPHLHSARTRPHGRQPSLLCFSIITTTILIRLSPCGWADLEGSSPMPGALDLFAACRGRRDQVGACPPGFATLFHSPPKTRSHPPPPAVPPRTPRLAKTSLWTSGFPCPRADRTPAAGRPWPLTSSDRSCFRSASTRCGPAGRSSHKTDPPGRPSEFRACGPPPRPGAGAVVGVACLATTENFRPARTLRASLPPAAPGLPRRPR